MRMRPNIGAVVVLNQVHGPGWGRSAGRLSSAGDGCGRLDWDLASTELLWTAKCVVSTVGRPEPVVGCDRGC
jgi:hypothetical protein